jgi:hypothetical protein
MTDKITLRSRNRNRFIQPDLFSWKPPPRRDDNRATLQIAKLFGLTFAHASTVVRLAGIRGSHHES